MYKLEEVQKYLAKVMTAERVKECYDLISDPESRVNTEDKKWVACLQDHEVQTVANAINEILHLGLAKDLILKKAIKDICKMLSNQDITHKHRIPFYVLVIDKLI